MSNTYVCIYVLQKGKNQFTISVASENDFFNSNKIFFLMLLLTIKNVYSFTPLILYLNKVENSNFSFIAKLESKEELKFTFMQMFALNLIFMIFIPNVKCDNKDRIKR